MDNWRSGTAESVRHLRSELSAERLPPYRTVDGDEHPWQKSPAGTDATLYRFVVARKGDVLAAKKQFIENLHWRSRVFPIPREGLTARLLDEDIRFRSLRRDTDGCPVLLVNFLFGEFETNDIPQVALVLASIRFFEETIDAMEEHGVHQMCTIVFGSPPPVAWAHVMVKVFQNNYPERLKSAVVYPVPSSFVSLVRQVMWFVDENTRSKVDMETDEWPLLRRFGYRSEDLPSEIRGGYIGVGERWKPDRRKILGLAYSFLLPHGRQVANLEEDLYRCARKASAAPSPSPRNETDLLSETDWSTWLFACCLQRPTHSADDCFFDSVDKFETPEPIRKKPTKEKTEEGSETRSCLSCLLSWLSGITALVLMMFILLLLGGGMHKRISPEL